MPGSRDGSDAIRPLGAEAQAALSRLSQALAALRREDAGHALAAARSGVALALRDLDAAGREMGRRPRWWKRLGGPAEPARGYLQAVDRAAVEVDRLAEALRREEERLSAKLRALRALHEEAMRLAQDLEERIAEGEERLDGGGAQAEAGGGDLREALGRRLHDLRLTRAVLARTALSIRSMMELDDLVIRRIVAMLGGILPLWDAQTAALVAAARAAPGMGLAPQDLDRVQSAAIQLHAALREASEREASVQALLSGRT